MAENLVSPTKRSTTVHIFLINYNSSLPLNITDILGLHALGIF